MADDPNPALRAELVAALAVITPMIRGLKDLLAMPLPTDLSASLNSQLNDSERRQGLLQTVINDLNTVVTDLGSLQNDGYPALDVVTMGPATLTELQNYMSDIAAASGIFLSPTPASLTFNARAPHTDVPQPVPDQSVVAKP